MELQALLKDLVAAKKKKKKKKTLKCVSVERFFDDKLQDKNAGQRSRLSLHLKNK